MKLLLVVTSTPVTPPFSFSCSCSYKYPGLEYGDCCVLGGGGKSSSRSIDGRAPPLLVLVLVLVDLVLPPPLLFGDDALGVTVMDVGVEGIELMVMHVALAVMGISVTMGGRSS